MKKLISILLLFLYLVSTTELYQLLKIPELIEHYIEHKELNPDMTLTAFLRTHYDHPVKDGDYGKDQKLPFIIHTTPLALVFIIGNIFHFELKNDQFKQVKSRKIPSKNNNFCYKGFLRTAWEPPRYLFS
ncbi:MULTISPECIES: hypothetical protein [Chryseobacterium]|uniref:Uncharacterized protein n=1 Tax=Chryseobacterium candidae TaxID=1978493 RepID=A0ABY2R9A5_9FLAO|nr:MULTISPECIES: hypothetical protein [Chryseobacterium]PXW09758.1 hypothetical protein C8D70_11560 [Chryseobacterium sp. CBTAP 102]THV62195.1 hypothetical protein EK417_06170 [Chryseobacterium candidae]